MTYSEIIVYDMLKAIDDMLRAAEQLSYQAAGKEELADAITRSRMALDKARQCR